MEVIHSGNISTFTQLGEDALAALTLKAPIHNPTCTGTVSGISKAMVELGNVDSTSDLAKPISTAKQTALNLKYSQADANILRNYTYALGTALDENYHVKAEVAQFVSQLNSNVQRSALSGKRRYQFIWSIINTYCDRTQFY